jgi:hypothetical protein
VEGRDGYNVTVYRREREEREERREKRREKIGAKTRRAFFRLFFFFLRSALYRSQ